MGVFTSRYTSHVPDEQGLIVYSKEEQEVWKILYNRQMQIIQGRASKEFVEGVQKLNLSSVAIPQLPQVNKTLYALTGWRVHPVAALISAQEFFDLLANRYFPVATFIRCLAELEYVQEPDIFHEIFGHLPMLTVPVFADFLADYAKKVLTFPQSDWPLLQRLFWFTVEFGLIETPEGLRAFGGGILSSMGETPYSLESKKPLRVLFDPVAVLRTPYRIDVFQAIYFVIPDFSVLYSLVHSDLTPLLDMAKEWKEYPPLFASEEGDPNVHIHAC